MPDNKLLIPFVRTLSGIVLLSLAPLSVAQERSGSAADGEAVYEHWCSHCHDAGRGMPGTQSLRVKYGDSLPAVLTERDDLSAQAIKTFVRQGVLSMPPFRKTEITDNELDALASYLTE